MVHYMSVGCMRQNSHVSEMHCEHGIIIGPYSVVASLSCCTVLYDCTCYTCRCPHTKTRPSRISVCFYTCNNFAARCLNRNTDADPLSNSDASVADSSNDDAVVIDPVAARPRLPGRYISPADLKRIQQVTHR